MWVGCVVALVVGAGVLIDDIKKKKKDEKKIKMKKIRKNQMRKNRNI